MQEIAHQIMPNGDWRPYSDEDVEKAKEYRPFQIVKSKTTGVKKPRSYKQLKTYFGCCRLVADNNDDPMWNTKEKVDFQCRVACHFVNPDLVAVKRDGTVVFKYRSISFANLGHIAACNYFERAFDVMAKKIGITVDVMMENLIEYLETKRGGQ